MMDMTPKQLLGIGLHQWLAGLRATGKERQFQPSSYNFRSCYSVSQLPEGILMWPIFNTCRHLRYDIFGCAVCNHTHHHWLDCLCGHSSTGHRRRRDSGLQQEQQTEVKGSRAQHGLSVLQGWPSDTGADPLSALF
jgi:hypothetical protein